MQEVSGAFLSHADPKDDGSCAQCLPIANKFLGSDCKELLCVLQASAAMKDKVMASGDERKKAFTAYGAFKGCAKENKCNLKGLKAAADHFHINFDALAGLLQVETSVQDTVSCAQCLRPANDLVGSDCKDLICVVKAFDAQKEVIMATEAGRKKAGDVHDNLSRCAKENKCDLQPGISAAAELGLDLGADSIFRGSLLQTDAGLKAEKGMDMDTHMRYEDMDLLDFFHTKTEMVVIKGEIMTKQHAINMGLNVEGMTLDEPAEPKAKPKTVHEHAVSAQKHADAAAGSLKEAQAALEKTKANVKETLKTGKKIEGVAGDISEKYPKKQEENKAAPVKSSAITASVSLSLFLASAVGVMVY